MTYKFHAQYIKGPSHIIPIWFISSFMIGVLLLCLVFFPERSLKNALLANTRPEAVALFYLSQMVSKQPDNNDYRLALTEQLIGNHAWNQAKIQIQYLAKNPTLSTEVTLLQYQLQYTEFFGIKTPKERNIALVELQKNISSIRSLTLNQTQLQKLANIAVTINLPKLATEFYQRLNNDYHIKDPVELRKIAKIALYGSEYAVSAQYYVMASHNDKTLDLKRSDILSAINVLLQGNLYHDVSLLIGKLPENITNNKQMLVYLTKYALAANRPDLAQQFIRRALFMRGDVKS